MLEYLPLELLQYVFMMLSPCLDFPNVMLVCRRWREACRVVIRLRKDICSSAFHLRSPLKWSAPSAVSNGCSAHLVPSKRFGSTILFQNSSVYVFGGATSMLTTFNDMWVYDLSLKLWKRLPCSGELPTPRAHAKGAFVNDALYLFGGCHMLYRPAQGHLLSQVQINWLNDLKRFDCKRFSWSNVALKYANTDTPRDLEVNSGQSGCFLPESPNGDPCVLVLFGGISRSSSACVNNLCFVLPTEGCWYAAEDMHCVDSPWPSGRFGHSVCALDPFRMLVLFGNEAPPMSSPSSSVNEVPSSAEGEQPRVYEGQPAGDIWILTRSSFNDRKDWRFTTWVWAKVDCSPNIPGCPPIDFYHSAIIRLPYTDVRDQSVSHTNATCSQSSTVTYTILCVSRCTETLSEEAARQRRSRRLRYRSSSRTSRSQSHSPLINPEPDSPSSINGLCDSQRSYPQPCSSSSSLSPPNLGPSCVPDQSGSPLSTNQRLLDRRAKRLQALDAQERRLFGPRQTHNVSQSSNSTDEADLTSSLDDYRPPKNPLAVYSLRIRLSQLDDPQGHWLIPTKLDFIDLLNGPNDSLGFSCTFGSGCLFLFGGLCESDESPSSPNQPLARNADESHWHPENQSPNRYGFSPKSPATSPSSAKSTIQTASFYVLQARELVGTVV